MMLKILTKRERAILYSTLFVIVFAAGLHFFILPLLSEYNKVNKEISMVQAKLEKYRRLLSQKEQIESRYANFFSTLKIPSGERDSLTSALAELENLAKNANIRIIDLRPQVSKSSDAYRQILIDLRTDGTIEGYMNFIYHMENSLSLLKIRKFQLSAKSNVPALEGNFSISRFTIDH